MKTIQDLENAAYKAKYILSGTRGGRSRTGVVTQRDGNFEVWGKWPGFSPDSISCEKAEQEAIETAIKYLEAHYE